MALTRRFALRFAATSALAVGLAVGASLALFALRIDDTASAMSDSLAAALERRLHDETERALAEAVALTGAALESGDRMELMRGAIESLDATAARDVRVYGADGAALVDGAGDPSVFERPAPAPVRTIGAADGVRRWRDGDDLYAGRAICLETGDCLGAVVVALDGAELVEARAEAEAALAEAKARFWIEGAALGTLGAILGGLFAAMVGAAFVRRFSRSMEAAVEALERVAAGERGVTLETRDNQLEELAAAVDDVAAAMDKAAAAGEPPERNAIIDALPDGVFVAALSGELLAANAAFHALFGAPDGALLGEDACETLGVEPAETPEGLADALSAARAIERADGARVPVAVSARLTGEGETRRVVGVARETAAAADAAALHDAEARADAASKAKQEFLAVMSHELRTPLNGVLGGAAVLAGTKLDENQRGFLSLVEASGKRMLNLVTDLLDYRRADADDRAAPGPHAVDLEQIAQDIAAGVAERAAQKGLDLHVRVQPGAPPVFADAEALLEIGEQLAENAVKFTQSGHVGVEIGWERGENGRVEATLRVEDTGPGVPPQDRERIFEAFAMGDGSSSRENGGTGLGLSIARKLANRIGGAIGVETATGGGAVFRLTFSAEADPEAAAAAPAADLTGVTTLVVDPVDGARAAARDALAHAGATVEEADSAEAALAALDARPYDLVAPSDAALAGPGGDALLARLGALAADGRPQAALALSSRAGAEPPRDLPERIERLSLNAPSADLLRAAEAALIAAGRRSPAGAEQAAPDAPPAVEAVEGGKHRTRVLLADPNAVTRVVLESYLKKAGLDVSTADDGVKALNAFKAYAPDLVLIDVGMPVMSGIEAVKAMRRHERAGGGEPAPVLGLIGAVREGERERCALAGISDFLSKPVRTEELEAKLERWLVLRKTEGETNLAV